MGWKQCLFFNSLSLVHSFGKCINIPGSSQGLPSVGLRLLESHCLFLKRIPEQKIFHKPWDNHSKEHPRFSASNNTATVVSPWGPFTSHPSLIQDWASELDRAGSEWVARKLHFYLQGSQGLCRLKVKPSTNTSQQYIIKPSRHVGIQVWGLLADCSGLPLISEAESRSFCKHGKVIMSSFLVLFQSKGRQFISLSHLNQASAQGKMLSSIAVSFAFLWGFAEWWSSISRSWEWAVMLQPCGFCDFSVARKGVYCSFWKSLNHYMLIAASFSYSSKKLREKCTPSLAEQSEIWGISCMRSICLQHKNLWMRYPAGWRFQRKQQRETTKRMRRKKSTK